MRRPGSDPEQFPMKAFVGMISDEVQTLRELGWDDAAIAKLIAEKSAIQITAEEIATNYAPEELRHREHHGEE